MIIKGLVSIIIPTHNNAHYIQSAVESCLKQTYDKIEVLVIDDGSTDNTYEVLKSYIEEKKINYIYQQNQERSAARNNGMKLSKGEFIQFLDADDLIGIKKLEKQIEFLESHKDSIGVYCRTEFFKLQSENIISRTVNDYQGNILRKLVYYNFLPINSVLIRRTDILFDESMNLAEDWDFWLRICLQNDKFGFINEVLSFVRVHENNTSKDNIKMIKGEIRVLKKFEKYNLLQSEIKSTIFKKKFVIHEDERLKYYFSAIGCNLINIVILTGFVVKYTFISWNAKRKSIYDG